MVVTAEYFEMAPLGAGNHGDAELTGQIQPHLGDAGARQQHRNAHLRHLDHHLRGEPPCGVEDLVVASLAAHPELTGQGIHRIVAPHILDKGEDFRATADGAAMHGTGHLVGFVMGRQRLEQGIEGALFQLRRCQDHPFKLLHHAAIHGALTAA